MAEQEIVEFDEVYDPDIENAQQRENQATSRETRDFAIFLREKRTFSTSYLSEFLQRFDSLITHAPILQLVKSYSSGLIETSVIRLEPEWVALEHHYKRLLTIPMPLVAIQLLFYGSPTRTNRDLWLGVALHCRLLHFQRLSTIPMLPYAV
ncbi:hypothetical protein Q3G72_013510 [Acer saccharum]|nr:hypothetical protein Q3G72_013510 [Acer saccharum]